MSQPINAEYYSEAELRQIGFAEIGTDVLIDRTCRFFSPDKIRFGSHVRLDSFCTLSAGPGGIRIGNYVHLSTATGLAGAEEIVIADFCGLSSRVAVFSSTEDHSGTTLTNPTIAKEFRRNINKPVHLKKHVLIGSGSVILPGVTIGTAASVGALSLVNKSIPDFMIVSGNPIRKIGMRSQEILQKEAAFLAQQKDTPGT